MAKTPELDWERPLAGKVALVTGASRGIGAAIAATLGRDGAKVVGLDIPQAADDLRAVTGAIDGEAIGLDITAEDAPERIASHFAKGGVDIVVHNAGVTKDRTIAKMPEERWAQLMEINLSSEERINDALLDGKRLNPNGRIVCVSSMSGIAGNSGQTNYAASKAGVIGMVESMAPELAKRKATINAVAPGFIETKMTGGDADRPARSRPPAQQPQPGRPAGRRRRDDRLVRQPRLDRRQRQHRPRLRPEPAGGLRWRPAPSTAPPASCRSTRGRRRRWSRAPRCCRSSPAAAARSPTST